jgi:nucleotide-binding universal stress UspA family protein
MNNPGQDGRVRSYKTQMLRALLIALDLSPVDGRVVGRAGLLPLAEDARVTLVHVVAKKLSASDQQRAERDAQKALKAQAVELTRALPPGVTVRCVIKLGAAATAIVDCAKSVKAELIVMGRGGGRIIADEFIGSTAERVLRGGQVPVLVVRLPPKSPYQRSALALDIDEAAPAAIALIERVLSAARAPATIIHAVDPPYHGLFYPSQSAEDAHAYRDHYRRKALSEITRLLARARGHTGATPGDATQWKTHVRCGSPRSVIRKAVKRGRVDLLVLGTRGRSGLSHAFLGSVAGDVLRAVTCDVLVISPRRNASGPARASRSAARS